MKTTPQIIAIITLFIAAVIMFYSCNVIKSKSTFKSTTDSASVKKTDSSTSAKKDSVHTEHKEVDTTKKIFKGLKIEFEPDSCNNNNPIKIIHSGNTTVIDPGGRKIKSITEEDNQTTETKSTLSTLTSVNTAFKSDKSSYDSSYKRQKILSENKGKNTSSYGFWLVVFIILIIIILIIYSYCQYKKITILSLINSIKNVI